MKRLTPEQSKRYRKYHIPHTGNLNSVKLNAIFLNKHNNKIHESAKFELAWIHEKYIVEAERKATPEEIQMFDLKTGKKIIDFVDLISGKEIEIVYKHESDKEIEFYRENGIIPFIVCDKFRCEKCGKEYPRRNKKNICKICKEEKNESKTKSCISKTKRI